MADPVTFSTISVSVFGPFPDRELFWVVTSTRQTGGIRLGCTTPAATEADAAAIARTALTEMADAIGWELDRG